MAHKRARSGPGPRLRAGSPQRGLRAVPVSIATDTPTAGPQRRPGVRGHLCDNGSFPRYGGSDGPLPPHCDAEHPALRGEERVVAGPRGAVRASPAEEDGAWPPRRLSADSIRPTPKRLRRDTPRGSTPGSCREPQRGRLAVRRRLGLAALERGGRACIRAWCQPLSLSAPPAPGPGAPAPQRPPPLTAAPEGRSEIDVVVAWWWHVQGAAELGEDGFQTEKNKMLREGVPPFKAAELEAAWVLPPREQK